MKKVSSFMLAAGIIAAPTISLAAPALASSDKVDICHANGSGKFVPLSVAKDSTAGGHIGHQDGADIIPTYSWVDKGVRYYFDGQNLDKAALLTTGCKAPATGVVASPVAPTYVPATCSDPSLPYGRVIVPGQLNLGEGVAEASRAGLSEDHTTWSVGYALKAATEDTVYSWPAGFNGTYTFTVVPLTADPMYVVDSKTGVGSCEMPDTGAGSWMLPAAGVGFGLMVAGFLMTRRRRTN
jgi:LPXTG-motif cell wall-anchored protein